MEALAWLTNYRPQVQGSKSPSFDPPTLRSLNMTPPRYFGTSDTRGHIPEKQWPQLHRCENLQTGFTVLLRLVWNDETWDIPPRLYAAKDRRGIHGLEGGGGGGPAGRNHLEDHGVDGVILLKFIFKKWYSLRQGQWRTLMNAVMNLLVP
jgi:hypothetical protein